MTFLQTLIDRAGALIGQMHHRDYLGCKCSAMWCMSIAPHINSFPGPVEEEIAIFCEARGFMPKSMGASIL